MPIIASRIDSPRSKRRDVADGGRQGGEAPDEEAGGMMGEPQRDPRAPGAGQTPSPADRRASPRFALRDVRGSLAWRAESGDVEIAVELRDISGGGAAVLASEAIPPGQSLRLLLAGDPTGLDPIDAAVVGTSPDPSGGRVIHLRFDRWIALDALLAGHRERRLWKRYPVRESRAGLSWADGTDDRTARGTLLNISGGGAAFAADILPAADALVRLRLEPGGRADAATEAVDGKVVAISEDPSGRRIAHIRFLDHCPMDFFNLAVHGSD